MSDDKQRETLWRYSEAAAFLRISPQRLRVLVQRRKVPHLRPFGKKGSRVLFSPERLREFVEAGAIEPVEK